MNAALDILQKKGGLSVEQAGALLSDIMDGKLSHEEVKEALLLLRDKGETTEEIVGFVETMRSHMREVIAPGAIDIVGTGGDGSGTFNISTASAFVVAGAGVPVAKHGNRAASSKCGSADVLEALGVNIELTPEQAAKVFKEVGFVFMLAPLFHPAMKAVGAARKELKVRTVFNLLGPFANPARTRRQLTGVPDVSAADMMSEAARRLGFERIFIVTSDDGMDEISLATLTQLYDVTPEGVTKSVIDPRRFNFASPGKNALLGGDAGLNAGIIRSLLAGEEGPKRDAVVLNSAFALLVSGSVATAEDGIARASESIESGAAQSVLDRLIQVTSVSES